MQLVLPAAAYVPAEQIEHTISLADDLVQELSVPLVYVTGVPEYPALQFQVYEATETDVAGEMAELATVARGGRTMASISLKLNAREYTRTSAIVPAY